MEVFLNLASCLCVVPDWYIPSWPDSLELWWRRYLPLSLCVWGSGSASAVTSGLELACAFAGHVCPADLPSLCSGFTVCQQKTLLWQRSRFCFGDTWQEYPALCSWLCARGGCFVGAVWPLVVRVEGGIALASALGLLAAVLAQPEQPFLFG